MTTAPIQFPLFTCFPELSKQEKLCCDAFLITTRNANTEALIPRSTTESKCAIAALGYHQPTGSPGFAAEEEEEDAGGEKADEDCQCKIAMAADAAVVAAKGTEEEGDTADAPSKLTMAQKRAQKRKEREVRSLTAPQSPFVGRASLDCLTRLTYSQSSSVTLKSSNVCTVVWVSCMRLHATTYQARMDAAFARASEVRRLTQGQGKGKASSGC